MLLHFNCSATLSQSFVQFCWLHYLFSTSPLFADVLMSEFELFIYCCCAGSLNEYASLTIHCIMHISSSQFMDNSSCHSHADLGYKDTFHCPCLSQNTSSFNQQSLQAPLPCVKMQKLIQITISTRTHTHSLSQVFVNFQECVSDLFFPKLHHHLPSHCHIFLLCSFSSFWHALGNFYIYLCGLVESQPKCRTEDALRIVPCNFHLLIFKTLTAQCSLECRVAEKKIKLNQNIDCLTGSTSHKKNSKSKQL